MGIEESEKEKDDIIITLFPNLRTLIFFNLEELEEWNGIGGEEEEEEEDCIKFTIMPRLEDLHIWSCEKLKSLPNFLRATPLQKLEMRWCSILKERCKRGTREEWPKISHIPNVEIDNEFVQRDGREVTSFDASSFSPWASFLLQKIKLKKKKLTFLLSAKI